MTTEEAKYLFTLTTFDTDPDRVATPLVLANSALAGGAAERLVPRSFPPVAELLETYLKSGGRIGVCPPCAKTHGVTDENRVPKSAWMGAAAVLAAGQGRQAFSF